MNIIIASGPVIIEDGKVLLDKNAVDSFWKFPGGKWEERDLSSNENTLEEVARRKAKEEVGIDIDIIRPLKPMILKKPVMQEHDKNTVVVLVHWLAHRIGNVVPGDDTLKWAWHDIHNLPLDCAPNIKPVIDEYLKSS